MTFGVAWIDFGFGYVVTSFVRLLCRVSFNSCFFVDFKFCRFVCVFVSLCALTLKLHVFLCKLILWMDLCFVLRCVLLFFGVPFAEFVFVAYTKTAFA